MLFRFLTALAATAAFTASAIAADTYTIDKTHTNILWGASHMGFSKSFGKFAEVTGSFTLDEAAPQNSSVEIKVQTASVVTGIPKFDDHLKSKDFFYSEAHPVATFKSTKVEPTGEKSAKIHGTLTMLGQTHPLVLDATLNKIGENSFNKKHTAGFSLTASIDRSLYGMNYGAPGIPNEVSLVIEAEGIKEGAVAANDAQ